MQTRTSTETTPCACSGGAERIAAGADAVLRQCGDLVNAVTDDAYRSESRVLAGGTIGKHLRHTLDHFAAALAARDGETIDYDHRERGVPVETDRAEAARVIDSLRSRLAEMRNAALDAPVRVRVMTDADGGEAELGSTRARELAFAAHHAVHHQAMMKAIAAEFGAHVAHEFGRAPSTLNHDRATR